MKSDGQNNLIHLFQKCIILEKWKSDINGSYSSLNKKEYISLGAESKKKSYAKHFGYKLATGLHLKKNEF